MANNELLVKRTAVMTGVALGSVAATKNSGAFIPAGAIITGIRIIVPGALTTTAASGTLVLKVGTVPICATTVITAAIPARTVATTIALLDPNGVYVPVTAELNVVMGTTNNSTSNITPDIFVDYLYLNQG